MYHNRAGSNHRWFNLLLVFLAKAISWPLLTIQSRPHLSYHVFARQMAQDLLLRLRQISTFRVVIILTLSWLVAYEVVIMTTYGPPITTDVASGHRLVFSGTAKHGQCDYIVLSATNGLFSLHETATRTTKGLLCIQLCLGINGNAKVNMNTRISKIYLKKVFFRY